MINVYEQISINKRKSWVVIAGFTLFVASVVYILGRAFGYGPQFVGLALIFSGLMSFVSYWNSDKIILGLSGARPASRNDNFVFYTATENLALAAQLPMPKLYVIDDSAMNAFATGRDPEHAVVCATTGLLARLNRTEIEAVIGHELSHIRFYDMRLMSLVTVMVGTVTLMADWAIRTRCFGGRRKNSEEGQLQALLLLLGIFMVLLSPLIANLIKLAISRRREFQADAGSVMLTRQPEGLISALKKLDADKEPLEAANKATAHLYISDPLKNLKHSVGWFAGLFDTHPSIVDRVSALEKMK